MHKVLCADITCKFHGDKDNCLAKKVKLAYRNMNTVNEGRVDMLICRTYEESDYIKYLKKEIGIESPSKMMEEYARKGLEDGN